MSTPDAKRTPDTISDLKTMVVDYAKQETIVPLKGLGRYLGYGVAGAVLVGLGVFLLAMAGLRVLQTETGTTFTGNWSFAPYLIVLLGLTLIMGILVLAIQRGRNRS